MLKVTKLLKRVKSRLKSRNNELKLNVLKRVLRKMHHNEPFQIKFLRLTAYDIMNTIELVETRKKPNKNA